MVELWVTLRASTWRAGARSPTGSAGKTGAAALPRVPYRSSYSWRQPVRFTLALRATTPRRFACWRVRFRDRGRGPRVRLWAQRGNGRGRPPTRCLTQLRSAERASSHLKERTTAGYAAESSASEMLREPMKSAIASTDESTNLSPLPAVDCNSQEQQLGIC